MYKSIILIFLFGLIIAVNAQNINNNNNRQLLQTASDSEGRIDVKGKDTILLNNNLSMPIIALGTAGYNNSIAQDAVTKAIQMGFKHIHSAYDYYNLPGIGKALKKRDREEIFLTSMTSPCIHTAAPPKRNVTNSQECYDTTLKELNELLTLLDVEYIDLVLLHGPSEPFGYEGGCSKKICELNQAQYNAYKTFYKENKARGIGVSNFCQSCLECLENNANDKNKEQHVIEDDLVPPAVNQIQLHVGMGSDPEGLISYCNDNNIAVQAYSPLAHGEVVSDPLCKKIGQTYERSAAEVGLKWVLQQGRKQGAIVVKSDKISSMKEDLQSLTWELNDDDVNILSQATVPKGQQNGRPSWGCAK